MTSARGSKVTVATLDPGLLRRRRGKKFFDEYSKEYGDDDPNPYAIYGYEAGQLLAIDMLERADDPTDPASVIEAMFATAGSRLDPRHVLDRRERRHVADRLRRLQRRRTARWSSTRASRARPTTAPSNQGDREAGVESRHAALVRRHRSASASSGALAKVQRGSAARPDRAAAGDAGRIGDPRPRRRRQPHPARQQPRRRRLQRRDLGAGRASATRSSTGSSS